MSPRILIAEDDPDIGALLRLQIQDCGAQVRVEPNGRRALLLAQHGSWDLLILDWLLPGLDGVAICKHLRASEYRMPILLLTARTGESDRVSGLDAGADDYVAKPFSMAELKARVRAHLRRAVPRDDANRAAQPHVIEAGPLRLDLLARAASIRGRELLLANREFELLAYFASHPSRVFTRQQLLEAVWGAGFDGYEYTVNSHINRLRAKLETNPHEPQNLLTVWGVGYRFEPAAAT
jgi:DNA-binding response OmpR family regulator